MKTDLAEGGDGAASGPVTIRCWREGRVQVISFDRPERRNAWNATCARETVDAVIAANADPDVGAIVLTGEGEIYCAGADLKSADYDAATQRRLTPASYTMGEGDRNWIALMERSKPIVAAINGPAIGIGATHALAVDIRLAADNASFAFPFLRLGAMPECGSTALLSRLVGVGRATDILLTSDTISAEQALEWGLVTRLYPAAELRSEAIALAAELAKLKPLQMQLTKRMLARNCGNSDATSIMEVENRAFIELLKALKRDKPLGD